MVVLAPSTSLTLPSGRAKPLVRGEGDGNPAAWSPLKGSVPGVRSPGVCSGLPAYCWGELVPFGRREHEVSFVVLLTLFSL